MNKEQSRSRTVLRSLYRGFILSYLCLDQGCSI